MKKISVIIPCYNVEQWIDRCIKSVAVQTIGMENLEVICVDDASTDGTWEHLQKWERMFPENVLLIRQEVNRRQGAARNIGLQYASADWIAFVDSDDWLEPDYFEQLYAPTEKHACDVVVCGHEADNSEALSYFSEEKRSGGGGDRYIEADSIEKKKEMFLWKILTEFAWAKIIRKRLLLERQIYFPEGLVYEDNYWHVLLHIYADHIYRTEKKLYHYFMRSSSTVHARNDQHHLDRITVQLLKWKEYEKRGFLQTFRVELEYDFLLYAVHFIKTLVFRYDQPSFSHYRLQQEIVRQKIPADIMEMYKDAFSGINGICFDALFRPLDQAGFQEFVEYVRKYVMDEMKKIQEACDGKGQDSQ